jgi:glycosyltransferase involved in cell wall biosynthesis
MVPMMGQARILLLVPHLGGGGAEKVTALLAQHLSSRFEVHLGLATQTATPDNISMHEGVTVHGLGMRRVRAAAIPLLRLVRKIRPQVILSNMAHLNFLVLMERGLYPRGTRILVRQNGTVSSQLSSGAMPPMTRMLYRRLYPQADRVICQSHAMARDLCQSLRLEPEKVAVLPNPVDLQQIRTEARIDTGQWKGPGPHLLAVGRLAQEKGFDVLLRAVAELRTESAQLELVIAGAGPQESALKKQAQALQLMDAVRFVGEVDSPAAYFSGATLFVLSSRHEGMSNALLEAAAAGLPIVTTPASEGIRELLSGQPGVWMADTVRCDALEQALRRALTALTPEKRFAHTWVEEFGLERAVAAYEALIDAELGRAAQ